MDRPSLLRLIQVLFIVVCAAVCIVAFIRFEISKASHHVEGIPTPPTNTTTQNQPPPKQPGKLKTQTDPAEVSKKPPVVERPTPLPATDTETPLTPPARQTNYEITPVSPQSGDHDGYTFSIRQCIRTGDAIGCWGMITNVTDSPANISFKDTSGVDDEGNSFLLLPIGFKGLGWAAHLIPNVPMRMELSVPDPHRNVKQINLDIHTEWGPANRTDDSVFQGVPVQ